MAGRVEYQVGVKTEGANRALQGLESSVRNVAAAWISMQGAAEAFDLAKQAAQVRDATKVFEAAGGNIEALRATTRGLISDAELIKKSNLAETMGIPRDAFAELARVADASAKKTGQSFDFMFESIIVGSARQSKQILDNLGILVSVEKANRDYAESLGKTVKELTDAEKKQAFLNEVLRQGRPLIDEVAASGANASDKYAKWAASMDNLKGAFGGFIDNAVQFWQPVLDDLIGSVEKIAGVSSEGTGIDGAIKQLEADIAQATSAMAALRKFGEENGFDDATLASIRGVREEIVGYRSKLSRLEGLRAFGMQGAPYLERPPEAAAGAASSPSARARGRGAAGPGLFDVATPNEFYAQTINPFLEVEESARRVARTFGDDMPAAIKKAAEEVETFGSLAAGSLDMVAGSVASLGADTVVALVTGQAGALDAMLASFLEMTGKQLVANSILHGFEAIATANPLLGGVAAAEAAAGVAMIGGSLPFAASASGGGASSAGVNRGARSSAAPSGGGGVTNIQLVYGVPGHPEHAARTIREVERDGGRLLGDGLRRGRR